MNMARIFPLLLIFLLASFSTGYAQPVGEDITIGQSFKLHSKILNEERPYLIYLPDDYDEEGEALSVLYLLDGDGHFHHTTGVVSFLRNNRRIPNMMVVGIPNTNDRTRDLTPLIERDTAAARQMETAGGADNMLAFIKDELIPHIEDSYNTSSFRILTGHSFGGLFAVHTLLTEPNLFDGYISISPSMWWDDQNQVTIADTVLPKHEELDCYFYMTMGDEGGTMLGGAMKLAGLFEEMTAEKFEWDFKVMEEETHGSIPHRSTYYGLEAIFKDWYRADFQELYAGGGLNNIKKHYEYVSTKLGNDIRPPEMDMNNLGYRLMNNDNLDDALNVFLENIKLYPSSYNVYDSAAEAYMNREENDKAIEYYKKSMRLNPGNTNGVEMLKKLGVDYDPEELAVEISDQDKSNFVGTYAVSAGGELTVLVEDGKLKAEHPAIPTQTMHYYSDNLFLLVPQNMPMKFTVNDQGKATAFELQAGIGFTVTGKRVDPGDKESEDK